MNVSEIFPERLRYLRQLAKFTQKDLADRSGATQQQIALYESGRSAPSIDTLALLTVALATTSDYLLGLSPEPKRNVLPMSNLDEDESEVLKILQNQDRDNKHRLLQIMRLAAR